MSHHHHRAKLLAACTGSRSRERPRLARAEQIGDAAPAERRMRRVVADVVAPVPATLALRVRARRDRDGERVAALDPAAEVISTKRRSSPSDAERRIVIAPAPRWSPRPRATNRSCPSGAPPRAPSAPARAPRECDAIWRSALDVGNLGKRARFHTWAKIVASSG